MSNTRPTPAHFLDDARGIYLPRDFARIVDQRWWFGITPENLAILEEGPDHEHYWEAWDEVCKDAFAYLPRKASSEYDPTIIETMGRARAATDTAERDRLLSPVPGVRWTLYQDANLFLIPAGMEWSDEHDWFVWPADEVES